jgi:hypothetical protein
MPDLMGAVHLRLVSDTGTASFLAKNLTGSERQKCRGENTAD